MKGFLIYLTLTVVFSFLTVSCSSLKKKFSKKSDIEGPMAQDILSKDMDSDSQGSDSGSIDGLSTVFFAYDSSALLESTKEALRMNAKWIEDNSKVTRIELEGHCDSMGSEAYNIGLGLRRAQSVKNFLMSEGVSADRFSIVSYGEERPLSPSDHSRNRRVNFVPVY